MNPYLSEATPSRPVFVEDGATVGMMKQQEFLDACNLADVKATKAQARKFRHGRGKAYAALHGQRQASAA